MYPFTIIIRIDNDMNVIWEKIYRFNYYYGAFYSHALELINGDLLDGCSVQGGVNMFLFKMSAQGDSLDFSSWTGTGDQSGELWDLTYNLDSTTFWMHTEWAYYQGHGGQVSSIVEVDSDLQYINHMYYPESYRAPYNSIPWSGNKLISGGSSRVPDMVNQDIDYYISAYFLDEDGNLTGMPKQSIIPISDAVIYPNPGSKAITVRTALKNCTFQIFDSNGRQLLVKPIKDNIISIDMDDKPSGNYPYTLMQQGKIINSGIWIKD
jgi:hypothetical protein